MFLTIKKERNGMRKQVAIVGILTFILSIGLTGCTERIIENGVEVVTYSVETQKYDFGEADFIKLADGFVYSKDSERYEITVTIRNVAGEMLDRIVISLNFYDKNNSYLGTKVQTIRGLDASYTEDFIITYTKYEDSFEIVDHLDFDIDT